ncbi:posible transcriptional regulator [Bacillus paralicheniformis]|nr:posible transcriptional regulator [Bacillus paralicheniformis]
MIKVLTKVNKSFMFNIDKKEHKRLERGVIMVKKIHIKRDFVLQYMIEHNLSLNQLAIEIGVSPATLSRVLNGERRPGQLVIGKMIQYFNKKFEDLFYYKDVDKSQ